MGFLVQKHSGVVDGGVSTKVSFLIVNRQQLKGGVKGGSKGKGKASAALDKKVSQALTMNVVILDQSYLFDSIIAGKPINPSKYWQHHLPDVK